jgi:hypothetical protein
MGCECGSETHHPSRLRCRRKLEYRHSHDDTTHNGWLLSFCKPGPDGVQLISRGFTGYHGFLDTELLE